MFELIFLIALILYVIQSLIFSFGSKKKFPQLADENLPNISILVAARNEEKNILRNLQSLNELEYPSEKIEIIIIDDRSNDRTGELIDSFIKDKPKFKKIISPDEIAHLKGKANALANAIRISRGDVILVTDADCAVSKTWAKTLASYYTENVAIVNGFTNQKAETQFEGMQHLDFLYLLTVASGTINFGFPISCIGNNMSFLKKAYYDVGGYESLPFSVTEDSNLLLAINRLKKYKIIYPLEYDGVVESIPCPDLKSLFRQKKRWGIGGLNVPKSSYIIMVSGYVINLCILLLPFFYSNMALLFVVIKLLIDFFVLFRTSKTLKNLNKLKYFFAFEIYYLIYVLILPFVVIFSRKVKWKGRVFSK